MIDTKKIEIKGNAIFIDDNEKLLKIAEEKGLNATLTDREGKTKDSKYRIINSLKEID